MSMTRELVDVQQDTKASPGQLLGVRAASLCPSEVHFWLAGWSPWNLQPGPFRNYFQQQYLKSEINQGLIIP